MGASGEKESDDRYSLWTQIGRLYNRPMSGLLYNRLSQLTFKHYKEAEIVSLLDMGNKGLSGRYDWC